MLPRTVSFGWVTRLRGLRLGLSSRAATVLTASRAVLGMFCRTEVRSMPGMTPNRDGNDLGGGQPVLTGPSFVDADNIDAIAEFAANDPR